LQWVDVDLDGGFLVVRRSRHRPQYAHGCPEPCGRKAAGYCPQKRRTNPELTVTKSRAGRRAVGLPEQLVDLLRAHLKAQEAEREAAGKRWEENGLVFPDEHGRSPSHRRDWTEWKDLLAEAKVRDGRYTTRATRPPRFYSSSVSPSGPSWGSWGGPPRPWPRGISTWSMPCGRTSRSRWMV
jgi:hypothetical protein